MKDEPTSPLVHNRYTLISRFDLPPCRIRRQVVEELPLTIWKVHGCILHYLGGDSVGGPSGSRIVVSKEERATRQRARYDRLNAARRSSFAKTDEAP